jgi:hypothetical protein
MTSRRTAASDPSRLPIPNYGRGAFYGLAGTIIAAIVWAAYLFFTDSYNILMPVAAGWIASASVRQGMGRVDDPGTWLSIYFTVLIVFLGEFFFFTWLFYSATGHLFIGRALSELAGHFRADLKGLLFMVLFTGLGCFVAVINCRESRKKPTKKAAAPENGAKESNGNGAA